MTHWTCENHLIVPWSTRQSTWYLRVRAAWRCLLLIGARIWIIWLTESNSFDMNLICLHFWWVAYLPGRPWFNAWFNICGNSQSCFQKCAKFALEKISYLCGCWLLPLPLLLFLHLQRLLGTGMQSICKFSLLCRVCKCSSIWLLSIFPCWLPVTPSPLCHLRVFCVISTLERIERCLLSVRPIVYTLPGGLAQLCSCSTQPHWAMQMMHGCLLAPGWMLAPLCLCHCLRFFSCCTRLSLSLCVCLGRVLAKGAEFGKWRCNIRGNWIAQGTHFK